ncbi:hypothetical protein C1S80_29035 [Mycolicibacterium aubagnense]|nr:hypothetical protein C1S80_29035 [Mycolicibacterium aubagnense]
MLEAAATKLAAHAVPVAHPPLGNDETSVSAAARLTEHGAVLASRAGDGAAVLQAAAAALYQATGTYTAVDTANVSVVALTGNPIAPTPTAPPAVTANVQPIDVPVLPSAPRPGEVTAAMMKAGTPSSGQAFIKNCNAIGGSFRDAASSAHSAAGLVNDHLTGAAGPRIHQALMSFGDWSTHMGTHADTVAQSASSHATRFTQVQRATPTPTDYESVQQRFAKAQAINASHPGMGVPAMVQAQNDYMDLNQRTTVSMAGYHTGEFPQAPPPPPPAVHIVEPAPAQNDSASAGQPAPGRHVAEEKHPGAPADDAAAAADDAGAELGTGGDGLDQLGASPLGAGGGASEMASTMPALLTGVLGGLVGAVTAIPQGAAQQAQSLASQAMEGMSGLSKGLAGKDGLDTPSLGDGPSLPGFDPSGLGGGGGGGGEPSTAPAASASDLPPAGSGTSMLSSASSSPAAGPAMTSGARVEPVSAGPGGAPMMMPPMGAGGGMGAAGSGARPMKEPDKLIKALKAANSEPVKGEVLRRQVVATADDPLDNDENDKPKPTVGVGSRRLRQQLKGDK